MRTALDAVAVAERYIGYTEKPGNDNIFGIWMGWNYQPWCAEFVSFCTYTSGTPVPATNAKGSASAFAFQDWAIRNGRWDIKPDVGALIIFHGYNNEGHIGIVRSVDSLVHVIEGNSNIGGSPGCVTGRAYAFTSSEIMGYAHPMYLKGPANPPPPSPTHIAWPGTFYTLTSPYMRGTNVGWIQSRLNHYGANLHTDDVFGPITFGAVKAFQSTHKAFADGVVGPITWDRLQT